MPNRSPRFSLMLSCILLLGLSTGICEADVTHSRPPAAGQQLDAAWPGRSVPQQTTPEPTLLPLLELGSVEPRWMDSGRGGILSLYGAAFTPQTQVRLIGYGLLETTFVDAGTLKAVVPPSVPAHWYDVEVRREDGFVATIWEGLRVTAPPGTPEPTAFPTDAPTLTPGQPFLSARNYTVEPTSVRAGGEFVVHLEIVNSGSRPADNVLLVCTGGGFVPIGETGRSLGRLEVGQAVTVDQRGRAPANAGAGPVNLEFTASANDLSGQQYSFPVNVPVEVLAGATGKGQPQVVIEKSQTDPPIVLPGELFTMTLQLANRGSRTAANALVSLADSQAVVPAATNGIATLRSLPVNQAVTVTVAATLAFSGSLNSQYVSLPVSLVYSDYDGQKYQSSQNVGLRVSTSLAAQPEIVLSRYETEPADVGPGDTLTLTLYLTNVGGGDASRLTLTLGGASGDSLKPFAPLGSGNVRYVAELPAASTLALEQPLLVDGNATSGAAYVSLNLAYDDAREVRRSSNQVLSLVVRRRPQLKIGFYRALDPAIVGQPLALPVEVVNLSQATLNTSTVELTSEQMEITEGVVYLGSLDGGAPASVDALGVPQKTGALALLVTVNYLDDFSQPRTITKTLSVEVTEDAAGPVEPESELPQEAGGGSLPGRILRALLGLGS